VSFPTVIITKFEVDTSIR